LNDNFLKERFSKWHFVVETRGNETVVAVCKQFLCIKRELIAYCHNANAGGLIKIFESLSDYISPYWGSIKLKFDKQLKGSQMISEEGRYEIEYWAFLVINSDQDCFLKYVMNANACHAMNDNARPFSPALKSMLIVSRLRAFLIRATVIGSLRCLKVILNSIRLTKRTNAYISYALESAADHGHNNCLQAIINYLRLHSFTCDEERIANALTMSATGGYTDCLQTLIDWPQLSESSVKLSATAKALYEAAKCGHKDCVQAIIACSWFHEIRLNDDEDQDFTLSSALVKCAKRGHIECLKVFIDCSRFHEISALTLSNAWQAAASRGHEGCLQAFKDCSRFHEIVSLLRSLFNWH